MGSPTLVDSAAGRLEANVRDHASACDDVPAPDCGTVGIPPLMSKRTLGILDGGRGGAVDRARRRRGITGVDKGGA